MKSGHRHRWEIRFNGMDVMAICINNPSPTQNSDDICFASLNRIQIQSKLNNAETIKQTEQRIKGEIIAWLTE